MDSATGPLDLGSARHEANEERGRTTRGHSKLRGRSQVNESLGDVQKSTTPSSSYKIRPTTQPKRIAHGKKESLSKKALPQTVLPVRASVDSSTSYSISSLGGWPEFPQHKKRRHQTNPTVKPDDSLERPTSGKGSNMTVPHRRGLDEAFPEPAIANNDTSIDTHKAHRTGRAGSPISNNGDKELEGTASRSCDQPTSASTDRSRVQPKLVNSYAPTIIQNLGYDTRHFVTLEPDRREHKGYEPSVRRRGQQTSFTSLSEIDQASDVTKLSSTTTGHDMTLYQGASKSLGFAAYEPEEIFMSPEYLTKLNQLVPSEQTLERKGFVMHQLNDRDLQHKMRCSMCKKMMKSDRRQRQDKHKVKPGGENAQSSAGRKAVSDVQSLDETTGTENNTKDQEKEEIWNCRFHVGTEFWSNGRKIWSCCSARADNFAPPNACSGAANHVLESYYDGELLSLYQLYPTPPNHEALTAVALDCEMGVAVNGDSELIRVTLIDYFSGRSLIDSLVFPNQAMQHLSTKFSGVSFQQLNKAKRDGKAIKGVEAARQQVWRFVGPETTVVAHGGISDFTALRWIHGRILDTVLLEPQSLEERQRRIEQQEGQKKKQEGHAALKDPKNPTLNASAQGKAAGRANTMAMDSTSAHLETDNLVDLGIASASTDNAHQNSTISQPLTSSQPSFSNNSNAKREQNNKRSRGPKAPGTRSLKALAKTKLHRDIQTSKDGHDSLEDALAARDLADWAVTNNAASIEEVFKEQVEFEKSMQEKYGSKEERKEARSAQRWKDKIAEATRKDTAEKEKTAASSVPKVVEWRGLGMEDWNKESATRGGQYAAGPRAPNVLLYQGAPGIQGAGAGNGYIDPYDETLGREKAEGGL